MQGVRSQLCEFTNHSRKLHSLNMALSRLGHAHDHTHQKLPGNHTMISFMYIPQSRRSSTAFDDLQAKLLLAQEQQRQETRKQFETQAEFREYMRKQMEEQSKLQMMVKTSSKVQPGCLIRPIFFVFKAVWPHACMHA